MTGVPTMYSRMLPHLRDQARLRSLRFLRCGSAPITVRLHEEVEAALRPGITVRSGDVVRVDIPAPSAAKPRPEALPPDVLYYDPDVIVVDKPAGMVVHPAVGHADATSSTRSCTTYGT